MRAWLTCWLCAALAGGCTDDRPGGGRGAGAGFVPAADSGLPADEGEGEGEAEGEPGPPLPASIEVTLAPNPSRAGETIDVACHVLDAQGEPVAAPVSVAVEPPDGVSNDGRHLSAQRVPAGGGYTVRCQVDPAGPSATETWTVLPGPTTRLEAEATPEVVRSGDALDVVVRAWDAFGNEATPELDWSVADEAFRLTALANGRLRMVGSGWTTIVGADGESGLSVELDVGVDRDPPAIEIAAPARASFVPAPAAVVVEGHVFDDTGIDELRLFGEPVEVDAQGAFSLALPAPEPGLHILSSEATDLAGRRAEGARAFLYGRFAEVGTWVPAALRVGLNRAFLDDDDPDLDDVAALAELYAAQASFAPGRIGLDCGGWIDLSDLRYDPPSVDLWPRDGGIGARATVRNLSVRYDGEYCQETYVLGCQCVGFDGRATAGSVVATAGADLDAIDCRPRVAPDPSDAQVNDLDIQLGGLASLLNPIIGLFEGYVRGEFEAAIEAQLDEMLGGSLAGVLDGLALPEALPLPPPMEGEIPLETCFSAVDFDDDGGHLDADGRFPVEQVLELPEHAGALTSPGAAPSLRGPHAVGLAVDDDLLNALLFDAWRAGLIEAVPLDVGALAGGALPIPIEELTLTGLLPPVVAPAKARGDGVSLTMGIGDLIVRARTELGDLEAAVSARFPVTVGMVDSRVVLRPTEDPEEVELELEILEAPPLGAMSALLGALEELLRAQLVPLLLGRPLEFEIPVFALDGLGVPELAGRALTFTNTEVSLDGPAGEHLTVRGELVAR